MRRSPSRCASASRRRPSGWRARGFGWPRPHRPWPPILGLAVVLLGAPASGVAQDPEEEPRPVVRAVKIEGNEAFSGDEIKRSIATRASGCKSLFLQPFCLLGLGFSKRIVRLDPRELRTDVARIRVFYYRRGYRSTAVDTALIREDNAVEVKFVVTENEPVRLRRVEVSGLEGILDSAQVVSSLPAKRGQPFSELAVTASQQQMETALRNRGYARAQVLIDAFLPSNDPLSAEVTLRAVPGKRTRIGRIQVEGTREVDPESVRRLLSFRSGNRYNEEEIVRSQRNLYSLALFEYADVRPDLSGSDTLVDVTVQVNEADIRDVRLGLGLTTAECFEIEAGWTHRNFFGGTRRLQVTGAISNIFTAQLAGSFPCNQAGVKDGDDSPFNELDWRIRADFQQPWFISSRNSLRLGLFAERRSLPDIFARRSFGGDITLARELTRGMPVTLLYRAELDQLVAGSADFLFCGSFGICRPDDIRELEDPRVLASLGTSLSRNRTDVVFDPTQGYRLSLEAEHGSELVGSGYFFNRLQGELSAYRSLGRQTVLAVRVRGGWVRPIGDGVDVDASRTGDVEDVTHPLKRLYAGGPTTVRGYGQNLLGPKVLEAEPDVLVRDAGCDIDDIMADQNLWTCRPSDRQLPSGDVDPRSIGGLNLIVANIELRFPFAGERWRGAAFVDLGQVWTPGDVTGGLEDLAWSPGVGLRYLSPVGPLRLDIGYNTGGTERRQAITQLDDGTILQVVDPQGNPILFEYDPFDEEGLAALLSRLQLNFSIGQAF